MTTIQARMQHPTQLLDGANKAIYGLLRSVEQADVPELTLGLVHLRVSQINGCSLCVDGGVKTAKKNGETDERLHAVAAWREMPYFDDAERAALALAESMTRIADRADAVSDEVWDEAAKHFDERGMAALVTYIATTNLFNRLNAATRQSAGSWG